MSRLPAPPSSSLASSGGARGFLLVWQALAHALAYRRLGAGKQSSSVKSVEQARAGEEPRLAYGTWNVLREMDVRHPAALLLQEMIEGHHRAYGIGCTTLLAYVGLFADAVTQLRQQMQLQPSLVAHTLADIRDRCSALLEQGSCVLPLTRLIDEFLASQPASLVASSVLAAAAKLAPAPLPSDSEDESDASWFFEDDAADEAPPAMQQPTTAALQTAVPAASSLHGFLTQIATRLCPAQEASAAAAVAVVHRMLRADGVTDLSGLRRAVASADAKSDLMEQWDLAGVVKLQSRMGAVPAATVPLTTESAAASSSMHRWELVEGLLLDLFPTELPAVRAALTQQQERRDSQISSSSVRHSSSAAAASARQLLAQDTAVSVGVVLVLGDVSAPSSHSAVSVNRAAASSSSAAATAMQQVLQRDEQRLGEFLSRLLRRLRSLGVGLVLAKGSFNKAVLAHLRAAGIVCLECVNLPQLEAASRIVVAPVVAELAEVAAAHVGRARLRLQRVGWDAELVHRNVVREMERDKDSAASQSSVHKLLLMADEEDGTSPDAHAVHHLTLLSSHSTALHAHMWNTSFWSCVCRLRQVLRDRCVLRGGGAVERLWIRAIDGHAETLQADVARVLESSSVAATQGDASRAAQLEALPQQLAVHRAVAQAFRSYLHLLLTNGDEGTPEQRWVEAQGQADAEQARFLAGSEADSTQCLYECRGSKLSALSLTVRLFQLFLHTDATLLCAHGRTLYQSMDGRHVRGTAAYDIL